MKLTIPFETAEWYLPSKDRGAQILAEVIAETRTWRQTAVRSGISRADIELIAAAFAETESYPARLSPIHSRATPGEAAKLEPSIDEMQAKSAAIPATDRGPRAPLHREHKKRVLKK